MLYMAITVSIWSVFVFLIPIHTFNAWRRDSHTAETQEITKKRLQRKRQLLNNRRQRALALATLVQPLLQAGIVSGAAHTVDLQQVHTRLDKVNVALNMLGNVVPGQISTTSYILVKDNLLPARHVGLARLFVRMNVVLCPQQFFDLICLGIKLNPLLVHRLRDPVACDTHRLQPVADTVHTLLGWSEEIVDLLSGIVFSIARRLGVGTAERFPISKPWTA